MGLQLPISYGQVAPAVGKTPGGEGGMLAPPPSWHLGLIPSSSCPTYTAAE